ncbi:MAG: protein-disulfide reductase DsbD family protein [Pyrinomonadaceae bacterium]|nr:protein-disulfide reductase DsbD family protein [Pyrinomonadaceae bacterium]
MKKSLNFLLLFAFASLCAQGQNPVTWKIESSHTGRIKVNEKIQAKLSAKIDEGWYIYAIEQPDEGGPVPMRISLPENSDFVFDGPIDAPKPLSKFDQNFQIESKFLVKEAVFKIPLRAVNETQSDSLALNVRYQACNDTVCLPPKTVLVSFSAVVSEKEPVTEASQSSSQTPLWSFLWLAITLGALSLLTPCVFPMIPITVSYFTNHAEKNRVKALKLALIYCLGIISTFTLLGMLIAIFVGAAGINLFAANPWVNILIAAIFIAFAFNLFGAYEIRVPSGVLTWLDRVARTREGEGGAILGTLLMGLTFTLTSFTCTSPFVGTVLVSASQGDWQMPLLGMFAFSLVFASPFFVLALIPQYMASLPKAGGWMNSLKVSMGFLEVAAAMKFISNADVVWKWGIFNRTVVLSFWVAIGLIMTFYLLGKFHLFHDSKTEKIGSLRLTAAIVTLAASLYLFTGLFGFSLGELESFLPPELDKPRSLLYKEQESEWINNDLEKAKQIARLEKKRVFIDFTGYTCTNCRWMEANIFTKPAVKSELKKFVLVKLFTDGQGEIYEKHQRFQQEKFKTVALPFYAVIEPDETIVSTFPGMTRDPDEFVQFLRQSLTPSQRLP